MASPALACRALEALAGLSEDQRAARFAEMYRLALESVDAQQSLTHDERNALAQDPFHLPDSESGRADLRRVLGDLKTAFTTIDAAHGAAVLARLREIARSGTSTAKREENRETEGVTRRPVARPEGGFVHSALLPVPLLLTGGKRFVSTHGLRSVPLDPRTPFTPSERYSELYLHAGEEWVLGLSSPSSGLSPPRVRWEPVDHTQTPKGDPPFEMAKLFHPDAKKFASFALSPDDQSIAARDGNGRLFLFVKEAQGQITRRDLREANLLGFDSSGKHLWLLRWSSNEGEHPTIHDVETGEERHVDVRMASAVFGRGRKPGTVASLTVETSLAQGPHALYREMDAANGSVHSRVEIPLASASIQASLLATQPVLLRSDQSAGGRLRDRKFRLILSSKDTGEDRAVGRWPGVLHSLSSSPDGKTIAVRYQTSEGDSSVFHLETFDLEKWLRLNHAVPASSGSSE